MKSNEQFARKCISHASRLINRRFRIVFVVKRALRYIEIKPASTEELNIFFNTMQCFLIDNDLLATPVIGDDGDLFINFSSFQFQVGNYSQAAPADFLESVVGEFHHHRIVESFLPPDGFSKSPFDDESITRRLPMPLKHLRDGGEIIMHVRRVIRGPVNFNANRVYHTVNWSSWGMDHQGVVSLTDLVNDDGIVVAIETKYPDSLDMAKHGPRNITFALTVEEFLGYAERKSLLFSAVNIDGGFTVTRKPA